MRVYQKLFTGKLINNFEQVHQLKQLKPVLLEDYELIISIFKKSFLKTNVFTHLLEIKVHCVDSQRRLCFVF